ncbi:S-layer homology domain-containing protein [Paenibacillus xylanexedens]|uniref:S-layer homology domain-containing protein n=1 Tax=Paenibacillus xylanexedens TaxID=528191 RepID=UPI0021B59073|nr:S-layer homology domain-containing protein [Paenibacillus xylanexedens]
MGVASAAGPATVTFTSTDSSAWADGIAVDGDGGSTDIPNRVYHFYNISDTSGTVFVKPLLFANEAQYGYFPFLTTYDVQTYESWKGMGIQRSDSSKFQIDGLNYSNWGEGPINLVIEGYRDGVRVATYPFTNDDVVNNYNSKRLTLGTDFNNVDKVLLYSVDQTSWHGINDIILDDAVVPGVIDAAAPTINTQPTNQNADVGASSPVLTLGANTSDGGTLSYQWYSNATNSNTGGTPVSGATSSSYAAPTTSAGTTYYYAVVTNTNNGVSGNQTTSTTSSVAQVTVNALVNAVAPTINTQPTSDTANVGATSPTLSVGASSSDGGTLSYQWYSNETNSTTGGTPISGATSSTYDAPTTSAGTTYYYAVVTNTNNGVSGNQTMTTTSSVAQVTVNALVNAVAPTINTQPTSDTANVGATSPTLSVGASSSDGGTLSYQWYSNATNSTTGGTPISGATSSTYDAPTTSAGTTYYYAVVTNTNNGVSGNKTTSMTSSVAQVTVNALINAAAPTINTQPVNDTANVGATSPTLSVGASTSDGGTLSYQWYSNATNSTTGGTPISGATSSTYDAPTTSAGTTYYYAVVTNTNNSVSGIQTMTTTSNVVEITIHALVNATAPTMTTQPANDTATVGATSPTLSVGASTSDGGTLSYQWYSNATNSTTGGTPISGATSSTYDAPTTSAGTTYYYAVVTNTNNGVSGIQTTSTTSSVAQVTVQTVNLPNAPANPQNLVATPGNHQVQLNWNLVPEAAYYEIYLSTVTGQFSSTAITTVTDGNYRVENLMNGTTYYFMVKAGGIGGLSAGSNEVTATPLSVISAPTGVTAIAGNGQATVSFNTPSDQGGSLVTEYEVTVLPGNTVVTGVGSPIIVTGLTNGTSYTFTVRAINASGKSEPSLPSIAIIPVVPTSTDGNTGNSGGSTVGGNSTPVQPPGSGTPTPTTSGSSGVDVLVNGKVERIGTSKLSENNGQSTNTITVDSAKLDEKLSSEGNGATVTILLNTKSDIVIGELNGQMIKNMEDKRAVLKIQAPFATYTLPSGQINIQALSNQIGQSIDLKDIQIQIEIATPRAEMLKVVADAAEKNKFTLVAPTHNFEARVMYGDRIIDITKFNVYVERTVAIPDGVDINRITTGVVIEQDGSVRHVPTQVVVNDSKYFAKVNSLTNSTYSIVWNPIEFHDVQNHWAKSEVNDMGSRMVMEGTGEGLFTPERDITRAEFAIVLARSLGLKLNASASAFTDVANDAWYSPAINTAYEYQLLEGFEDGTFRPDEKITREQAMTIMAKAMELTGLKGKLSASSESIGLEKFSDTTDVSSWAYSGMVDSVQTGIFTGRNQGKLAPKAPITRAEVAAIAKRLLQKSGLI